jgi:hypothetical protein
MKRGSQFHARRRLALFPAGTVVAVAMALSMPVDLRTACAAEKVSIATSLVTPFFDTYYLEGKIRASDSLAVVVNTSYLTLRTDDWKTRAGTVGAGVDYYFRGSALRGWYLEVIGEAWLASKRHQPSGEVAPLGVGYAGIALAGYQFIFARGPIVDLGAGVVAFHLPSAGVELGGGPISSGTLTRIYPAAKINVGWSF